MFDVFDINKDGMIDGEEFELVVLDRFSSQLNHLNEKDRKTGQRLVQMLAGEMYAALDEGGEDALDWTSFMNYKSVKKDLQFEVETKLKDLIKK